jgi:hypothetical protein
MILIHRRRCVLRTFRPMVRVSATYVYEYFSASHLLAAATEQGKILRQLPLPKGRACLGTTEAISGSQPRKRELNERLDWLSSGNRTLEGR